MSYLRKKLQAIMACADFKGYLREVTGTDSVTLTDCMGSDMTSLSLVGNAVQDGTPSPDNPVEIQGCGDRTANLLDISYFASTSAGYVENGEVYVTGYPYQPGITPEEFLAITGLQEGDTFTTYGDLQILGTDTNSLNIQFATKNAGLNYVVLMEYGKSHTSTIPVGFNSTNYHTLYIYAGGGDGLRGIWRNLMVVKGAPDERPPYEPYGYKIPVEVSGRNLLDYTKATDRFGTPLTIINNGVSWDSHVSYYFLIPCDLKSGMTVRFFCKSDYPENSDIISSFMVHYVDGSAEYQGIDYSITLKNDVDRIQIRKRNASIESETPIKVTDIMLVQGTYTADTIPPYEPYHEPQTFNVYMDKPLYATGDVGDEITLDFEHKTATRTDKIRQLKDFEVASVVSVPPDTQLCINCRASHLWAPNSFISATPMLSNYFINGVFSNASIEGIATHTNPETDYQWYIYLNKTRIDMTADDTTATLATKCNAYIQTLTGREAYYQLLTPATTDISAMQDWDTIPKLWRGTAIVTVKTTVPTKAITARYYAAKKED